MWCMYIPFPLPDLHFLARPPHLGSEGQESTPGCYSLYLQCRAPAYGPEQGQLRFWHASSHHITGNKRGGTWPSTLQHSQTVTSAPAGTPAKGAESQIMKGLKTVSPSLCQASDRYRYVRQAASHRTRTNKVLRTRSPFPELSRVTSCRTAFLRYTFDGCWHRLMERAAVGAFGKRMYN